MMCETTSSGVWMRYEGVAGDSTVWVWSGGGRKKMEGCVKMWRRRDGW